MPVISEWWWGNSPEQNPFLFQKIEFGENNPNDDILFLRDFENTTVLKKENSRE